MASFFVTERCCTILQEVVISKYEIKKKLDELHDICRSLCRSDFTHPEVNIKLKPYEFQWKRIISYKKDILLKLKQQHIVLYYNHQEKPMVSLYESYLHSDHGINQLFDLYLKSFFFNHFTGSVLDNRSIESHHVLLKVSINSLITDLKQQKR
jgi:hypothetical protein